MHLNRKFWWDYFGMCWHPLEHVGQSGGHWLQFANPRVLIEDYPAEHVKKPLVNKLVGWLASLAVAGYTAIAVRKVVKTEMVAAEPMVKPSPFSIFEARTWAAILVASFATALIYPTALGTTARTCLPFLLASTVLGYIVIIG